MSERADPHTPTVLSGAAEPAPQAPASSSSRRRRLIALVVLLPLALLFLSGGLNWGYHTRTESHSFLSKLRDFSPASMGVPQPDR